jgi:hypothetical protein
LQTGTNSINATEKAKQQKKSTKTVENETKRTVLVAKHAVALVLFGVAVLQCNDDENMDVVVL